MSSFLGQKIIINLSEFMALKRDSTQLHELLKNKEQAKHDAVSDMEGGGILPVMPKLKEAEDQVPSDGNKVYYSGFQGTKVREEDILNKVPKIYRTKVKQILDKLAQDKGNLEIDSSGYFILNKVATKVNINEIAPYFIQKGKIEVPEEYNSVLTELQRILPDEEKEDKSASQEGQGLRTSETDEWYYIRPFLSRK